MIVDEEVEDLEEEDLDCEGEMDPESPPWDIYGEEDIEGEASDELDEHENTALLRASAAKTEIVITPMSPVGFTFQFCLILFFSYLCLRIRTYFVFLATEYLNVGAGVTIGRRLSQCCWRQINGPAQTGRERAVDHNRDAVG